MLKHAMIHNLGTYFSSFQERKRDTGIESLSYDTLTSQLHDEELANKSQSKTVSLATNTKSKKQNQGKSPGIGKDHVAKTCPWCKREDKKEDDCWYKHPEKATDGWRKRQKERRGMDKDSEAAWLTLTNTFPSFFTHSDRCKTTYDTSSKV